MTGLPEIPRGGFLHANRIVPVGRASAFCECGTLSLVGLGLQGCSCSRSQWLDCFARGRGTLVPRKPA